MMDNLARWIAWHLPARVAYWATIRVHAHATCTDFSDKHPDEVPISTTLKTWDKHTDRTWKSYAQ